MYTISESCMKQESRCYKSKDYILQLRDLRFHQLQDIWLWQVQEIGVQQLLGSESPFFFY